MYVLVNVDVDDETCVCVLEGSWYISPQGNIKLAHKKRKKVLLSNPYDIYSKQELLVVTGTGEADGV